MKTDYSKYFTPDQVNIRYYKTPISTLFKNKGSFEEVDNVSVTIPDQSMDLKEMMERLAQGYAIEKMKRQPLFSNSNSFEDVDFARTPDFDLSDITHKINMGRLEEQLREEDRLLSESKTMDSDIKESDEVRDVKIEPIKDSSKKES